jgi:hypothetical protein
MEIAGLIAQFQTTDSEDTQKDLEAWLRTNPNYKAIIGLFEGVLEWLTTQAPRPGDIAQINASKALVCIVTVRQIKDAMPPVATISKKLLRTCECREVQLLLTRTMTLLLQKQSLFATPFTKGFVDSTRNTLKALRRAGASDECRKDAEAALRDIPAWR